MLLLEPSLLTNLYLIYLKLISGQQLCPYWRKCRSLSVEISTYGIPADTDSMETTAVVCYKGWRGGEWTG